MKIKFLLLSLSIIFNITSCNGQDKKDTKLPSEKVAQSSITDNFSKSENLYFDPEQKQIFSTSLNKNLGKFTVYYLPIQKKILIIMKILKTKTILLLYMMRQTL